MANTKPQQRAPSTVAGYLPGMAESQPDATAIYLATSGKDEQGRKKYLEITYRELDDRSEHIALGLLELGFEKGMRTVLMVKPSPELFALTFGMFKAGIPPVMVDPGIGMKHLKACLFKADPAAFIGITPAHAAPSAGRRSSSRSPSASASSGAGPPSSRSRSSGARPRPAASGCPTSSPTISRPSSSPRGAPARRRASSTGTA